LQALWLVGSTAMIIAAVCTTTVVAAMDHCIVPESSFIRMLHQVARHHRWQPGARVATAKRPQAARGRGAPPRAPLSAQIQRHASACCSRLRSPAARARELPRASNAPAAQARVNKVFALDCAHPRARRCLLPRAFRQRQRQDRGSGETEQVAESLCARMLHDVAERRRSHA
jgi:hypothetical protein